MKPTARKVLTGVALLLLAVVSQRLYRWPLPYAFEVSVGAAEWGHWVGLLAVLLWLVTALRQSTRWNILLHVLWSLVLLISWEPVLRAKALDPNFSFLRMALGWGGNPLPDREIQLPNGQWMDVYLPAQRGPGVLVVHGGSWARGSRRDFRALNGYLRQKGYFVASLDYRLAPAHPYPAALEDLDAAYDYLVEHAQDFRLDAKRMAWLGRSAGGHLALLEAYSRRPSRCVIGYYPPTDMLWSYEHPSNPRVLDSPAALRDFLGGPPDSRIDYYWHASPLQMVTAQAPPTLLLHGLPDDLVYPEQSRRLERRLTQLGVPCESLYLPWGHHGCDINLAGPSGQLCTLALERFLKRHLEAR